MRPRNSSATFSCNTVNPVTYALPAKPPTMATNGAAINKVDDDEAAMMNAPVPMTA